MTCTAGRDGGTNECTAVGNWKSTSGNITGNQNFIAQGTQNSGTWSFQTVTSPDPGMTNNNLDSVSCPTSTSCVAVGHAETYYQQTGNFSGALAVQGTETNGTWSWSTLSTDNTAAPSLAQYRRNGMHCGRGSGLAQPDRDVEWHRRVCSHSQPQPRRLLHGPL